MARAATTGLAASRKRIRARRGRAPCRRGRSGATGAAASTRLSGLAAVGGVVRAVSAARRGVVSDDRRRDPCHSRISRICLRREGGTVAGCSGVLIPCSDKGDASQCIGRPRRERGTTPGVRAERRSRQSVEEIERAGISSWQTSSLGSAVSAQIRDPAGILRRSGRGPTTHHGPSN